MPGRGEAELIKIGEDRYTVAIQTGVVIAVQRDGLSRVTALNAQMGRRPITAVRVPSP